MSTATSTPQDEQEQIARIERAQAETRQFAAEQNKPAAGADRFPRERFLAPVLAAGVPGGALAAAVPAILRACGGP